MCVDRRATTETLHQSEIESLNLALLEKEGQLNELSLENFRSTDGILQLFLV